MKTECITQFSSTVDSWLNAFNGGHSVWGLYIQPINPAPAPAPPVFYSRNPHQYFTPASNTKLLTAAASLTHFGANATLRTSVMASNSSAVVDLLVVGRGDPSLTDDSIRSLAAQIAAAGITSVGSLMADQSLYIQQGPPIDPAWEWEDVTDGDGSPQWPLSINQNTVTLTVSPASAVGQPCGLVWGNVGGAVPLLTTQLVPSQFSVVINQAVTVPANTPDADLWIDVELDLHSTVLTVSGNLPVGGGDIGNQTITLSVTDGTRYVLDSLAVALAAHGIRVANPERVALTQPFPVAAELTAAFKSEGAPIEVGFIVSSPFSDILTQCMLYSINFYAESFLRMVGVYATATDVTASVSTATARRLTIPFESAHEVIPYFELAGAEPLPSSRVNSKRVRSRRAGGGDAPAPEPVPTELTGLSKVHTILVSSVGVGDSTFAQHDGSGLSRRNLISPDALYGTVRGMVNSSQYGAFRASLPVAGVSGTLATRFRGTSVQGKAQAKTGTMTGVSSLSGYLQHPVFGDVVFIITSNDVSDSTSARQNMIDQIVVTLQNSINC